MRRVALWLSMVFIFSVPCEALVEYSALGSVARLIGLALAAFWLAAVVTTGRIRRPTPFHLTAFLLLAWNATSIFWSADPDRTLGHIITWGQLAVLVFILWDLLDTRQALLAGLQMYIYGTCAVLASVISNFLSGTTVTYERFSATGTNPNDAAMLLALGIPVAAYLANSKNTGFQSQVQQWINRAYIPSALLAMALSGSRTAFIASIPGIIFALFSTSRLGLWARFASILLLVSASVIVIPMIPEASFVRLGTTGAKILEGDLTGRTHIWAQGLTSFAEHPIIGVGSNMFRSVNIEGKVAHNSFLSVLVELGIVGLTLFGILLASVVANAARQSRWESAFWFSVLTVWAIGAFDMTWEYRKPTWLFLSFVIVSAALSTEPAKHKRIVPGIRLRSAENLIGT